MNRTLALAFVGALVGCTPAGGFVGESAFYAPGHRYRIRYDESRARLMPSGWRAVNYGTDHGGLRAVRRDRHWTDRYDIEGARGGLLWPRVDLLFVRREASASHLWIRRVLLDPVDVAAGMESALRSTPELPPASPHRLPLVPREARCFALSDSRETDAGVLVVDGRRGRYSRRQSMDGAHHAVLGTVDTGNFASVGGEPFHVWLVFGASGHWAHRERDEAALARLIRRLDFAE